MAKTERNLEGIKVLDFTRVLVGPTLTQVMRDNGADVIKIEKPFYGADERHFAPIHVGVTGEEQSGYYMMLNRGKKSVTMDLKDPECKEIIYKLFAWADVVAENFAPGVMKSLGIGYDVAKKINPGIVYCSMSCYGQEGPLSHLPGYDILAQAMSGLMWLTGEPDGKPMRSGTSIGDVNCTGYALSAILMSMIRKYRTGKGQYIDMSLRDCLSAVLETGIIRYTQSYGKDEPMRSGAYHATMMPYGVFDAGKGKYVIIVGLNPNHWESICKAMGKEEWGKQEKFKDSTARAKNQKEVIEVMEAWLQTFDNRDDALKILQAERVPCAPILSIPELLQDEQYLMRNNIVHIEDPVFGPVDVPATASVYSDTTVYNDAPPPVLGGNTSEVLRDVVGVSEDRIKAIVQKYGGK